MKINRKRLLISSLAACILLLSACSSSADSFDVKADNAPGSAIYDGEYYDGDYSSPEADISFTQNAASESGTITAEISAERKIVRSVNLSLETLAFDDAVAALTSKAESLGGYTEASDIAGTNIGSYANERYASFTFRIPADKLDSFLSDVGQLCNVVSKSENASDITDTYYDTQARLDSLLTQEKRLIAMLDGATELEYMLELEDKLSEVRYQIESYYSTIKRYDSYVSMSTVSISLNEVIEYKPTEIKPATFGERIAKAFSDSWSDFADGCRDFAVSFVYAVPTLIVIAVIALMLALIIAFSVRRVKKHRAVVQKSMDNKLSGKTDGDTPAETSVNADFTNNKH